MTTLQAVMVQLMQIFDKYANDDKSLSNAELNNLLKEEMPQLYKGAMNQSEVDRLLKDLDMNGDSKMDFQEFVVMVTALTCACYQCIP